MTGWLTLLQRELSLAFGRGSSVGIGMVFFLSLVILFPFSLGPDLITLRVVGPAILWAGPLLAILLGIEQLFQPDEEDGTLDIYRLSSTPMELIILAKAAAGWISLALPLIAVTPVFGTMLGMKAGPIIGCVISLLVGTPALVFFGTLCGALTVKVRRAGMLIAVIAVPFLVPALIFGVTAAIGFSSPEQPFLTAISILGAFSLFSGLVCAIGGAVLLRNMR